MTALQQQRRWDQIDSSTHTAATTTGANSTGNNGSSGNGYSSASRQQQQHRGSNANIVTVSAADVTRQGGSSGKDLEHLLQLVAMCIAGYTSYAAAVSSGSSSTEQQHGDEQVSCLVTHITLSLTVIAVEIL
jgi:lysophospholipase L1-like esterase